MVAEYVSCTKLLQNIITPCSWLKGKCTVTVLNKAMYCHWKVHADTSRISKDFTFLLVLCFPSPVACKSPWCWPEPWKIAKTKEVMVDGKGVPSSCSLFGNAAGRTVSAEAHCRCWLLASLCSGFLRACGWCLLMHHLASSLSLHHLAFWEGCLILALGEAEEVPRTSLGVEKGS